MNFLQKIIKALGSLTLLFIVIGVILGIVLVSVNGARNKATTSYSGSGGMAAPSTPGISFNSIEGDYYEESKTIQSDVSSGTSDSSSRLVIRTGTLSIVVKDIVDSAKKITSFTEGKTGWIVNSSISENQTVPSGAITIRVPAENFDEAMTYFRGLAVRVSYEGSQGQDVTDQYTDLQSQLRNLEAAEKQLLEIMEKSGEINHVLSVYRELKNTRNEIELIKGRMQYIEQSTKMATITVNLALSEDLLPIPPSEKWTPKYVLLQAWKDVLGFWRGFSYFMIRLFVWSQVWVPALIIFLLVRRFRRKRQSKAV